MREEEESAFPDAVNVVVADGADVVVVSLLSLLECSYILYILHFIASYC